MISNQKGFTIIELMIATAIFAGVFLLLITGSLAIANENDRGISKQNTQDVARTIADDISQSIEFNAASNSVSSTGVLQVTPNPYVGLICIGNAKYSYVLGVPYHSNSFYVGQHILIYNPQDPCTPTDVISPNFNTAAGNNIELVEGNARVASLSVTQVPGTTGLYKIEVRILYGDNDLLCSPSEAGPPNLISAMACNNTNSVLPQFKSITTTDCSNIANNDESAVPCFQDYAVSDLQCKSVTGSQFCAVSDITTFAQKRIQ